MKINVSANVEVAVVGLGLMGCSIVVSLLASGHQVVALAPILGEKEKAINHIVDLLRHADRSNLLSKGLSASVGALKVTDDYRDIATCKFVQECVIEDKEIKKVVYEKIEEQVSGNTIIATNTSAIPISELQTFVSHPNRFIGVHWAEPAYMTRFLEVTCGAKTDTDTAAYVMQLGGIWGKEPTLLKKDIRGFITNRLMYAVYREALTLVENGETTMEDADKVFRYDVGSWITLMGIFRRMDFMGFADYIDSFEGILPKLSNRTDVPDLMRPLVAAGARGIHNGKGFYDYDEKQAKAWEEAFAQFNKEIYDLATRYTEKHIREKVYNEEKKLSKI
ncbi:3-hydroxyacyl-CoA dehydrogenase family protein [Sphingobacterium sp. DN00404]|uniref:3-hydroxyacyl-CoA dehydrogenase family protein n=1 Tax=Sphingobacterium micropteri TaxID=2763501 RepID=A0ABR7YNJ7_9SPHI|nr:3-hydroxyacyl-CoA dehydrogenase family protein [Sphingobacterium micropteri]MBD1432888.1 3-hydroxyacyl-CoA dehydrogenase family protein [Sphingobacterium micropteri]